MCLYILSFLLVFHLTLYRSCSHRQAGGRVLGLSLRSRPGKWHEPAPRRRAAPAYPPYELPMAMRVPTTAGAPGQA